MAVKIGVAVQNRQVDSLGGTFYGGGNLKFYTGSQPATADTAPSGTLLCTITLPATPFAGGSGGTAALSGTWSSTAVAAGTVGWFRIQTSGNTHPLDGSVTVAGGGGQITFPTTPSLTWVIGDVITVGTFPLTQPAS